MPLEAISRDLSPGPRQRLEEAALALQMARARRLREGIDGDRLLEPDSNEQLQQRVRALVAQARDVLSVNQRSMTLEQFLPGHKVNRRMVRDGVTMVSLFETRAMTRSMLEFLAAADDMPYYCCYGPVQVKILDRAVVMLDGPVRDGETTVLLTEDHEVLSAALRYVHQVRSTALPAADYLERQRASHAAESEIRGVLTERQRLVAELLDGGATDEEVAHTMSLSVRTVRSEVAKILVVLRASNRFGAGRRYGELVD